MTREEAIKGLKNVKEQMFGKSPFTEALDMAIQALSQEPCDDAISREDAKKIYCHKICTVGVNCKDMPTLSCHILKKFDALPPVTQKSGKWIIIDDCEQFIAKCSECGRIEDSRMISKYPYCHCGAKMESEDKE